MMRGGRGINVPIHNLTDLVGVALLALLLLLVMWWMLGGGPLQALFTLLSAPEMATMLKVEVGLAGAAELIALADPFTVKENAIPSRAAELVQDACEALLKQRERWRLGGLQLVRVKEADAAAAWEGEWRRISESSGANSGEGDAGPALLVTLIALVSHRSMRLPDRVTSETIASVLRGLTRIEPRYLSAFAAVRRPEVGLGTVGELRELNPSLSPI